MTAPPLKFGEGGIYPHGWDSANSVWVASGVNTEGLQEVLCYGEDSVPSRKRIRTNSDGELVVQTSTINPSTVRYNREQIDAFGRIRVSDPTTVFDSKLITDSGPVDWDKLTVNTGAVVYDNAKAGVVLSVSASGDRALRQTFRRFNYQPGKSQLIAMTGVLRNSGTFSANITSRLGQYDDNAGVFFQYDATNGVQVAIRKATVDTLVPQSLWNLDTFDGTGLSGVTLDFTKVQFFLMNYEWLGAGPVWWGFVVGDAIHWVHRNDQANVKDTVYTETPNNPLRYEIISTGAGSGAMTEICCSIISEGGSNPSGRTFCSGLLTGITLSTLNPNKEQVMIAVRYKSINTAEVEINTDFITAATVTNNALFYLNVRLVRNVATQLRNAADTGPPTLSWTSVQDSAVEISRPAAAYVVNDNFSGTSGYIMEMGANVSKASVVTAVRNKMKLGFSIAGVSDILVVSAYPIDPVSQTLYATVGWQEL